jgi:hypothetical protein
MHGQNLPRDGTPTMQMQQAEPAGRRGVNTAVSPSSIRETQLMLCPAAVRTYKIRRRVRLHQSPCPSDQPKLLTADG